MSIPLEALETLAEAHNAAGQALFDACQGEVFPCDALALAVLDRSLGLVSGFKVLMTSGGYSSGMALLRLQLDNVLRLHGVISSGSAHRTAEKLLRGKQLNQLSNANGQKMTDGYLVRNLEATIPWLPDVYKNCSEYVHLSHQHVSYFLARCPTDENGKRQFIIGDEDDHVPSENKVQLVKAFVGATTGVAKLFTAWCGVRNTHGTNHQLKKIYQRTDA